MKPMDVGSVTMIPKGNLSSTPAQYGWLKNEYDKSNGAFLNSKSSAHPDFKCGFTGPGFDGKEWQTWYRGF